MDLHFIVPSDCYLVTYNSYIATLWFCEAVWQSNYESYDIRNGYPEMS